MNTEHDVTIQQYYRHACVLTAAVTVILAVLRTALTPTAFDQPLPYGIVLGAAGVVLAVLLVLSGLKHTPPITVGGRMARVSAAGAAVVGAAFVIFSGVTAHEWFAWGVVPYPSKATLNGFDQLLVFFLIAAGLAAGALFLLSAVRWWRCERTTRRCMPLLALAPVFWSWIRLIRYITSHVSSIGLFRNVYDLSMIVFEMLFFVLLARYVSGVGEKPSRFFFGVSLCTGLLCAVSCITRAALFLAQDQTAFDTCALVTAPDFGVAAFALITAFAQSFGTACEDEEPETEEEPLVKKDDGEGAEYLLSDQWFTVYDPEEERS